MAELDAQDPANLPPVGPLPQGTCVLLVPFRGSGWREPKYRTATFRETRTLVIVEWHGERLEFPKAELEYRGCRQNARPRGAKHRYNPPCYLHRMP